MAGIANPNYACNYLDPSEIRPVEVTNADWVGGVNKGGSNAPGIGINTGDYSPKVSDWSEDARDPQNSQHIGQATPSPVLATPDGDDNVQFIQAVADTPDDGQVGATGVYNRTGKTVPNGAWFWGHEPV